VDRPAAGDMQPLVDVSSGASASSEVARPVRLPEAVERPGHPRRASAGLDPRPRSPACNRRWRALVDGRHQVDGADDLITAPPRPPAQFTRTTPVLPRSTKMSRAIPPLRSTTIWRWPRTPYRSTFAAAAFASSASFNPATADSPHRPVIFISVVGCGTRPSAARCALASRAAVQSAEGSGKERGRWLEVRAGGQPNLRASVQWGVRVGRVSGPG